MGTRLYRVSPGGSIKRPGAGYDDDDRYVEPGYEFRADPDHNGPWAEALPELLARGLVSDVAADEAAQKEAAELDARLDALAAGPVVVPPLHPEPAPTSDDADDEPKAKAKAKADDDDDDK